MIILPLHVRDLPEVSEIEQRAYEFPWTDGIIRDCFKAGYSAWALRAGHNKLLGYSFMSMAVGEAHILNLCIDPAHQRKGLARYLLTHLLHVARAAHITLVLLEVRRSNKAAIRLYQSQGFQNTGVRKDYYPAADGREDAFILALDLV